MYIEPQIIAILGIILFAIFIRAIFGFGDALIEMPLIAVIIGIKSTTPLVALLANTVAVFILIKDWKKIQFKSVWPLVVSSALGIPIGLIFLKEINEAIVKSILAVIIITFSVYNLLKPEILRLKSEKSAWAFGFVAGILGGAYNTNGPPVVIYGTLRKWPPKTFRATLQGFFLPTGLMIISGHAISGLWTTAVWRLYIFALPVLISAYFIGNRLNKSIRKEKFEKYIHILLISIGLYLLFQSIWH
ncbi:MAG: sulfite exporter TauE/SafE family protein [bacterium]